MTTKIFPLQYFLIVQFLYSLLIDNDKNNDNTTLSFYHCKIGARISQCLYNATTDNNA